MDATRIIILSRNEKIIDQLQSILKPRPYMLALFKTLPAVFAKNDIVMLDEDFYERDGMPADLKNKINTGQVVYLTNSLQANRLNESSIGFHSDDFLLKSQLTKADVLKCIRHIEESQRLKQEIINQEKRYESLFYNAIDAGFFLTPDWQIENVNQVFINLFGATAQPKSKTAFGDLINNPLEYERLKIDFAAGAKNINREITFNRLSSQTKFPGYLKIAVLKEDSINAREQIKGYHGTIQNLVYKKRLQTIKENSERLSMIHRLSRALAHEIRNPLTNITLATDQLEDELEGSKEGIVYLDIIKRSSSLIDQLITRLLTSSAKKEVTYSEYDLIHLLQTVIDQAADRAKMENVKIIADFEVQSLRYLCDHEKLELAISNLLINSIEAIPDGTPGQVIVGLYEEDEFICIYVEDTGIGMTADEKKKLFDPFFTKKNKGRGLGLTATLGIIIEHNAHMEIESALNVGTTFTILLPRKFEKLVSHQNSLY